MNTKQFIQLANKKRLANKNKWVFLNENVNNIPLSYKAFDTWIQIFNYKGVTNSSSMNLNVTEFKQYLLNAIEG